MKISRRELLSKTISTSFISPFFRAKIINGRTIFSAAFCILLIVNLKTIKAQELSLPSGLSTSVAYAPALPQVIDTTDASSSAAADSLPPVVEPKLLPDNMSFGEKLLWSKNGLVHKIGLEPPLSPQERMGELHLRRGMLIAHQIGGFTTLALMLTADYFGQRVIDGRRDLGDVHQRLIAATILTYSATGLLAILSPPPLIRRDEESTTTLHKTLAWIHVLGMIVTPILGSTIRHRRLFNMDQAHFHQISGYLTTAVFATSMLVIVF